MRTQRIFLFDIFAFALTLLVVSLKVTNLISDVAGSCLDREYAHNAYRTAHADRGRPTLKDNEQFRNGLVRDLVF